MAGLLRRSGILYNRIEARLFDLRHGTDTTGKTPVGKLDEVVGENVAHGTGYQAVNEGQLRHVMEALAFPDGSVFVDVGCGKGKPLLLAASYPFVHRAIGVEFSGALCVTARQNAITYGQRRRIADKIVIRHQDAVGCNIEADQNIFFMNNPFDAELISAFIAKIDASVRRHPRAVWLLYYNPAHAGAIDAHPGFARETLFRFFGPGRDIAVYRSTRKAPATARGQIRWLV
jgi:SAM-dependent methyltransferase